MLGDIILTMYTNNIKCNWRNVCFWTFISWPCSEWWIFFILVKYEIKSGCLEFLNLFQCRKDRHTHNVFCIRVSKQKIWAKSIISASILYVRQSPLNSVNTLFSMVKLYMALQMQFECCMDIVRQNDLMLILENKNKLMMERGMVHVHCSILASNVFLKSLINVVLYMSFSVVFWSW